MEFNCGALRSALLKLWRKAAEIVRWYVLGNSGACHLAFFRIVREFVKSLSMDEVTGEEIASLLGIGTPSERSMEVCD